MDSLAYLHFENAFVSGHKKRPRGPRPVSKSLPPTSLRVAHEDGRVEHALNSYLCDHVANTTDVPSLVRAVDDDILLIFLSQREFPGIQLAVNTIALALYGRARDDQQALIEASVGYQRLLELAQTSGFLSIDNIETSLLIIFCMGRYEDAIGSAKRMSTFTSALHHDGSLALLKAYYKNGPSGSVVPNIVKHTRRGMIKSALLRGQELPNWIEQGAEYGEADLDLNFDEISIRLVAVRKGFRNLAQETSSQTVAEEKTSIQALTLVQATTEIESTMGKLAAVFLKLWPRTRHIISTGSVYDKLNIPSPPNFVYTYATIPHASVWLKYMATRILNLSTHISLLHHANQYPDERVRTELQLMLYTVACDLVASLPFCNGTLNLKTMEIEYGDMQTSTFRWIAWPLTLALLSEELPPWIRSMLEHTLSSGAKTAGVGILDHSPEVKLS